MALNSISDRSSSQQDKDRQTLLMVIPNYGYGGAQRVFSNLSSALSSEYRLVLVVFNNDQHDVYESSGIKLSLNVAAGRTLFSKFLRFIERCRKLRRIKNKYSCVATISHLEGANFINILSGGPGRKILCVHGSKTAPDSNRRGLIKVVERRGLIPVLFRRADRIVAVSQGIREELHTHFGVSKARIEVIRNGVNLELIGQMSRQPIPSEHEEIFKKPVIVYSGRLAPQKNPVPVIDIYFGVLQHLDCNLLILGDGPLKSAMQQRCDDLNLTFSESSSSPTTRILFTGFTTNPFAYLAKSSCYILTSDFEGFPLSPCEALACGLPSVCTDCPTGVREILSDKPEKSDTLLSVPEHVEYGILMPLIEESTYSQHVEMWAKTIVDILQTPNGMQSLRQRSKHRAKELSDVRSFGLWKKVINDIVKS
jgi:glycosyltransferase involved in cell wall biosynthesis